MPAVGRLCRIVVALSFGGAIAVSSTRASATQTDAAGRAVATEIVGSFGLVAPARSDYRTAAQALGYALDYPRVAYEGELGARFAVAFDRKFWIGPIVRLHVDHLGAPYDGLDPIWAESLTGGAREEFTFARFPPLFLWMDETFGVARVGRSGAYATLKAFDVRGGVGVRMGWSSHALRLRVGWSYGPTMGNVTDSAGGYDFGGLVVALDGVLRVAD